MWRLPLFTLLLLLWGCSSVDLDLFENDVSEAVFRHMFEELPAAFNTGEVPKTYFISFGYEIAAPRPSFLARFDDLAIRIERGGQAAALEHFVPRAGESVSENREDDAEVAMFQVARIEQLSPVLYEVEGAFLILGHDSIWSIYSVEVSSDGTPVIRSSRPYANEPGPETSSQVEASQ